MATTNPSEEQTTIQRYDCYYKNDFQDEYPALSKRDSAGDWVMHEDVVHFLRFWGGYLQGHREMLEDMKLHPKIIEAVRKAEKAFSEFGNE